MAISAAAVKDLRDKTGAGMMDCKKALTETDGDMEKAVDYLRKKGIASADKKAGRAASEGAVGSYIHMGGKIGVLVEVNCETDFVAKTDKFQDLIRDLAMHIAAAAPLCVRREELAADVVAREREIFRAQALESGKPEKVVDRIVEGKIEKFMKESCLLDQPFVKDTDKTVEEHVKELIGTIGENITVRRFARFVLGEGIEKRGDDLASEVASLVGGEG